MHVYAVSSFTWLMTTGENGYAVASPIVNGEASLAALCALVCEELRYRDLRNKCYGLTT